jgi:hypothetical protein
MFTTHEEFRRSIRCALKHLDNAKGNKAVIEVERIQEYLNEARQFLLIAEDGSKAMREG